MGGLYTKWKGKLNLNVIMESVSDVLTNADLQPHVELATFGTKTNHVSPFSRYTDI